MRQGLNGIGERLTRIRGEQSQAAFAPQVGLHKNTVGTYERGEREIGALALAGYVGMGWNANWILTGEGPERLDASQAPSPEGQLPQSVESQAEGLTNLKMALTAVEEALEAKSAYLPPARRVDAAIVVSRLLATGLADAEVSSLAGQMIGVMVGTTGENDGGKAAAGGSA